MANIAYFEIPTENVDRARHFYHSLLGWKIEPTKSPMDPSKVASMQYQSRSSTENKKKV
jgi:predicted enzyme related to lactoylglutathione lyase